MGHSGSQLSVGDSSASIRVTNQSRRSSLLIQVGARLRVHGSTDRDNRSCPLPRYTMRLCWPDEDRPDDFVRLVDGKAAQMGSLSLSLLHW